MSSTFCCRLSKTVQPSRPSATGKQDFVWQLHYLPPEFTARRKRCHAAAASGGRHRRRPSQKLHGGCVRSDWSSVRTIAQVSFRAESSSGWLRPATLITGPKLLLADEPTGDLDGHTAEAVFAFDCSIYIASTNLPPSLLRITCRLPAAAIAY
jgi:hypothetical protein